MSNHDQDCQLSTSSDCPVQDGVRQIQRISPRAAIIGGGIPVNRLLPGPHRQLIGAWCFLDHAGPAELPEGQGLNVGPHPHIGLQTFTWMIKGQGLHRDSLGNEQLIRPGQVNLMTAGRGIVHTEESPDGERQIHAAQLWIALPEADKECPPAFDHYPDLPKWQAQGVQFTLLAGSFAGQRAPSRIYSPLVGIDLTWQTNSNQELALEQAFEYGVLVLEGSVQVNGELFAANELAYLGRGLHALTLTAEAGTRLLLLGGEPFTQQIHLWWNFVAYSREDIAVALEDWNQNNLGRFPRVPGYAGARLTAPPLPWLTNAVTG